MAENSSVWCSALDVAEDPLDLGQEPHVGHAVGLVDDHVGHVGDVERAAVDEVDGPARRADHEVDAALELLHLLLEWARRRRWR